MSKNQDSNLYLNFKLFQTYYVKFCLAGGQRFEDHVFQLVLKKVIKFTPKCHESLVSLNEFVDSEE